VISMIPSSPPTCLFNRPETTNAMTSRLDHRRLPEKALGRHVRPVSGAMSADASDRARGNGATGSSSYVRVVA
jgi:hypothetical protein